MLLNITHQCTATALLSKILLQVDQLNRTSCGKPNTLSVDSANHFLVLGSTMNENNNFRIFNISMC